VLTVIAPTNRERLRPIFAGFPGLHGVVDAALEGEMGMVRVDDPHNPRFAHIDLDFDLLAGDPNTEAAEEMVRGLSPPFGLVTSSPDWEPLVRRIWGARLETRTRVAFEPGEWDRPRLTSLKEGLPQDFLLKRIQLADAGRFEKLADSLVYNFPSLEDFAARGVGFGVDHEGRFVSGCASFALCSHSLEFEIQTHPDFRRRGLATACAAAMIEYCLDHGLKACWDAHNEMSAALATKLGFVRPAPYTAYEVND
jgi:GNAT superfamily N-acetyltransferase